MQIDRHDYIKEILKADKIDSGLSSRALVYEYISNDYEESTGDYWSPNAIRKFILKHYRNSFDTLHSPSTGETDKSYIKQASENEIEVQNNRGSEPFNFQQMYELFNIDPDEWLVSMATINRWGKPDYQTKMHLKRKKPELAELDLKPIRANLQYTSSVSPPDDTQAILVIGDAQMGFERDIVTGELRPYHDRGALDIVLQMAEVAIPDKIVILGDMLDLAVWSDRFVRKPEYNSTTQPSLIELRYFLHRLRDACPNAEMIYVVGNHEHRIKTLLFKYIPEIYTIKAVDDVSGKHPLCLSNLLGLSELDIDFHDNYPYDGVWITPDLEIYHGDTARALGKTASAIATKSDVSRIAGHIHRIETATRTVHLQDTIKTIEAHTIGCLCKIDGSVPGSPRNTPWQQGFGYIHVRKNRFCFQHIAIRQEGSERVAVWNTDELRSGEPDNYLHGLNNYTDYNFGGIV